MFVDTDLLRRGGDDFRRAAEHAAEGACQLARPPLAAGMFGDFPAADDFHDAISSACVRYVDALQGHHDKLSDFGARAYDTAYGFDTVEDDNTTALRDV